jgi:hypothetical protein
MRIKHAIAIKLMENWVVAGVNFVSTEHVAGEEGRHFPFTQENGLTSVSRQWRIQNKNLIRGHVGAKDMVLVNVVCVGPASPDMVLWKQEIVEILFDRNNRMQIVVEAENGPAAAAELDVEVISDAGLDHVQRMFFHAMETAVHLAENVRWYVRRGTKPDPRRHSV